MLNWDVHIGIILVLLGSALGQNIFAKRIHRKYWRDIAGKYNITISDSDGKSVDLEKILKELPPYFSSEDKTQLTWMAVVLLLLFIIPLIALYFILT